MVWIRAKAVIVLVAVDVGAKGFFSNLSQQVADWISDTTTPGGISQTGPPSIGGYGASGDGAGPFPGASTGGTTIVSWSTQHFTVTTGLSDTSQTAPVTDGGSMTPIQISSLSSPTFLSGTTTSRSALPSADVFVIEIGPAGSIESGAPGSKARRQSGSEFLMNAGVNIPADCSQAIRFELIDGELTSGGQKVSASPGLASARLAVSPVVGSITKTWEIVSDELLWRNSSFVGGQAGFCVDGATRRVFFITTGPGSEPAGCTPKQLTPMFAADCPGLNPDRGLLPAEETLILPPGVYFPESAPGDWACRATTEYWTVGQFTVDPAPTGLSRRLW